MTIVVGQYQFKQINLQYFFEEKSNLNISPALFPTTLDKI